MSLRRSKSSAPQYPRRGRTVLAGLGAAFLGAASLAGCGFDAVDEMGYHPEAAEQAVPDAGKPIPPIVVVPPPVDAGHDAGQEPEPDAGDFFAGGAPYPYFPDAG